MVIEVYLQHRFPIFFNEESSIDYPKTQLVLKKDKKKQVIDEYLKFEKKSIKNMLQFFLQNLENIIKNKCLESFYKF
jgi:hypothetical protein